MADKINFENRINDSVQVGDELYWTPVDPATNIAAPTPLLVGTITGIGEKYVLVTDGDAPSPFVQDTMFFMFKKKNTSSTNADGITVNSYSKSGTKGYYASVKMSTPDTTNTKLFALGSEVAQSSK